MRVLRWGSARAFFLQIPEKKHKNSFGFAGFLSIFAANKTEMTQRERIIEQTMQMFVTQGIKSVRMDDIARQLGVSKRTLYEQFGDKEGLLYLALEYYFDQSYHQCNLLCAGAENVLEALFMVLGKIMDDSVTTNRMMDNLKKFYPAVYTKLMQVGMEKNRTEMRQMLGQGIEEGLFVATINIDLAISVLYYTSSALMLRKDLILPEGITERQAFVQIVSNFFRGISTAKGLELVDNYLKRYEPEKIRE